MKQQQKFFVMMIMIRWMGMMMMIRRDGGVDLTKLEWRC